MTAAFFSLSRVARVRRIFLAGTLALLLCARLASAAYPPPVAARHGMVVSAEVDASRVGVGILKRGGNAVDAAVAVGLALAVVHPDAGNLAGGGFLMIHLPGRPDAAVDFRETAPGRASRTMYLDRGGKIIPRASTIGYRAVAVPGTVAGLALAERRFGRLSWQQVIQPAVDLAAHGFRVSRAVAEALADPDVQKMLNRFPESRRLFLPGGHPYREGDWMVRPDLARTLRRLRDQGPEEFYRGALAREMAADMKHSRGLMTVEDLARYRARIRKPVEGDYRGYHVVSMPPPSSGGIALIEMLNILSRYHLDAGGFGSAAAMQPMIEAMRRAFADRSRYLGDTDFVPVPVARLISTSYADERARTIEPGHASPSPQVGPGDPLTGERPETTHFSVVDGSGGAAACTYTLNGAFGSGATVPGTGILLNNEMDDFTSAPGVPNQFGLIQGEQNAIAPNKRPLSSMSPTFVLKNGKLVLVTGSPGGPTIINTVLEVLVNTIDFGMDAEAATAAPRFHNQWLPDLVRVETPGFSPDTLRLLTAMGYTFKPVTEMGDAETIAIDPATGTRYGGADPRGAGAAIGY